MVSYHSADRRLRRQIARCKINGASERTNDLRLDVAAKKQDLGQFNCAATSSRVELSRFGDDAALLGI
jgi:hypothetical protein